MSPLSAMTAALARSAKAVPSMKYAIAAVGVAAAVGLIAIFTGPVKNPPLAIALVIALMVVLVVFSVIASKAATLALGPAQFLIWVISILFAISVTLVLTSITFGWPPLLAEFIRKKPGGIAHQVPKLLWPRDGYSFDHSPRVVQLKWEAVPDASVYRTNVQFLVENSADNSIDWRRLEPVVVSPSTSANITLTGAERWRWRVTALDEAGAESSPSGWGTFVFPHVPAASVDPEYVLINNGDLLIIRGKSTKGKAAIQLNGEKGCKATYDWRFKESAGSPELSGTGKVFDQYVGGEKPNQLHVYGDHIIEAGPFHIRWSCSGDGTAGFVSKSSTFEVETILTGSLAEYEFG